MVALPLGGLAPLHPPEATHASADVALHASVVPLPRMTWLGFGANVITGFASMLTLLPLCEMPTALPQAARAEKATTLIAHRDFRVAMESNEIPKSRLQFSHRKLPAWLSDRRRQRINSINRLLALGLGRQNQAPLDDAMT